MVGDTLVEQLVSSGLASSRRIARELIGSGAISLNGNPVTEEARLLSHDSCLPGGYHLIRRGKKHFVLLCSDHGKSS